MRKILNKSKIKILFSILGIFCAPITFYFYYNDLIGLSLPFLIFLTLCYFLGKEKFFWKFFEENILIFLFFWIITLSILVNL